MTWILKPANSELYEKGTWINCCNSLTDSVWMRCPFNRLTRFEMVKNRHFNKHSRLDNYSLIATIPNNFF